MNSPLRALAPFLAILLFFCSSTATCPAATTAESDAGPSVASSQTVMIPGPLRSFERMAALSQKVPTERVLPLLARNINAQG